MTLTRVWLRLALASLELPAENYTVPVALQAMPYQAETHTRLASAPAAGTRPGSLGCGFHTTKRLKPLLVSALVQARIAWP